jgi:hypothetical protein
MKVWQRDWIVCVFCFLFFVELAHVLLPELGVEQGDAVLVEPLVLAALGELLLEVGDAVLLALHLQPRVVQLTLYLALLGGLRRSKQSVSFHFISLHFRRALLILESVEY